VSDGLTSTCETCWDECLMIGSVLDLRAGTLLLFEYLGRVDWRIIPVLCNGFLNVIVT
jgi:hypothetical protein